MKIWSLVLCAMFISGVFLAQDVYSQSLGTLTTDPACEDGTCTLKETVLSPDAAKVSQLNEYFEPLQDNPEYYGDRKFKTRLRDFEVNKIKSYKANFGKKIWVKSWTMDDVSEKLPLFGKKISVRKFYLTALEVAEDVAPYLRKELINSNVDFDAWAQKIEEFGRTYVNPEKAGKQKCHIEVADYQNGNYLMIQATKPFTKKMIYFIGENQNIIVEKLLEYKTREDRKK